jgi:hypothetical protein
MYELEADDLSPTDQVVEEGDGDGEKGRERGEKGEERKEKGESWEREE